MTIFEVLSLFGGLALFLFGMNIMGQALEKAAGSKLKELLAGQEVGALNRPSIHERIGLCDKGRRVRLGDKVRTDCGLEWEGNLFARTAAERASWYAFYQKLIRLRLKNRELTHGRFHLLDAGEDVPPEERTVVAFERRLRRSAVRCAVNLGPAPRRVPGLASQPGETVLYGKLEDGVLSAFSALVVRGG